MIGEEVCAAFFSCRARIRTKTFSKMRHCPGGPLKRNWTREAYYICRQLKYTLAYELLLISWCVCAKSPLHLSSHLLRALLQIKLALFDDDMNIPVDNIHSV